MKPASRRPSSAPREGTPSKSNNGPQSDLMPSEEEVNRDFKAVLIETLTPPAVRDRLMETQSIQQKWKFVLLHNEHAQHASMAWGEKEIMLLRTIDSSKTPDIQSLLTLKVWLTSASKDFMTSFLEANGVAVLTKVILLRVNNPHFNAVDAAMVYEALSCSKLVMNNSVGMRGCLLSPGCVDALAMCLKFDFKHLCLLVLEILAVICYSEASTKLVVKAMQLLARKGQQAPFACLSAALLDQDVEVKCGVLGLIKNLLLFSDAQDYQVLKGSMAALSLADCCHDAVAQIEAEFLFLGIQTAQLQLDDPQMGTPSHRSSLQRVSTSSSSHGTGRPPLLAVSNKLPSFLLPPGATATATTALSNKELELKIKRGKFTALKNLQASSSSAAAPSPTAATEGGGVTAAAAGSNPGSLPSSTPNSPQPAAVAAFFAAADSSQPVRPTTATATSTAHRSSWAGSTVSSAASSAASAHSSSAMSADRRRLQSYFVGSQAEFFLSGMLTGIRYKNKLLSGKKAKADPLFFTVDPDHFTCYSSHEAASAAASAGGSSGMEIDYQIAIPAILDVRSYTTDEDLLKLAEKSNKPKLHLLEIVTAERTIGLGCETKEGRDLWLKTLGLCRDQVILQRSSYYMQRTLFDLRDAVKYTRRFYKLVQDYEHFLHEDEVMEQQSRLLSLQGKQTRSASAGDDEGSRSDVQELFAFLEKELVASNKVNKLFPIFQELILMPSRTRSAWDAIPKAIKHIRRVFEQAHGSYDDLFEEADFAELLTRKEDDEGRPYAQMSKLAKQLIARENEVKQLTKELSVLRRELDEEKARPIVKAPSPSAPRKAVQFLGEGLLDIVDLLQCMKADAALALDPADCDVISTILSDQDRQLRSLKELHRRLDRDIEQLQSQLQAQQKQLDQQPNAAAAAPPAAAAAPDPRYTKYNAMKKMLPEGAVRQKMTMDGFKPEEIDAYLSCAVPLAASAAAAPPPPAPAMVPDPRYEKIVKLKRMLPEMVVRQKMTLEQFSSEEIEAFFSSNGEVPLVPAAGGEGGSSSSLTSSTAMPTLPLKAAKPLKVAAKAIAAVAAMPAKPLTHAKTKALYWTKLPETEAKDTVWQRLPACPLQPEQEQLLEEWFIMKAAAANQAAPAPVSSPSKQQKAASAPAAAVIEEVKLVSFVEAKRAHNILIITSKLKRSPQELQQLLKDMDPVVLTPDLTANIKTILPNKEEETQLKDYRVEEVSRLDGPSRFVFYLVAIPRLTQRVDCHELLFTWPHSRQEVANQLTIVLSACDELQRGEETIALLLHYILRIGNYLNEGSKFGEATAIKLDSLAKLSTVKSDKSSYGSIMNYLALVLTQQEQQQQQASAGQLLALGDDWKAVWAAAELSLQQVLGDVRQLEAGVNKVFVEVGKESKDDVNFLGRLEGFLAEAKPSLAAIKQQAQQAEAALSALMARYGEKCVVPSDEDPCKRFFSIFVDFSSQLHGAIELNDKRRKQEEKLKRQQQAAQAKAERRSILAAQAEAQAAAQAAAAAALAALEEQDQLLNLQIDMGSSLSPGKASRKQSISTGLQEENIFVRFHDQQEDENDDVREKFRQKLEQRKSLRIM